MAINLNNFVNTSIQYHLKSQVSSTRDTAVLIIGGDADTDVVYDSLEDFAKKYKVGERIYYYGYTYFANGGVKLRVIQHQTDPFVHKAYILTSDKAYGSFKTKTFYLDEKGAVVATPKSLELYDVNHLTGQETTSVDAYELEDNDFILITPYGEGYYTPEEATEGGYVLDSENNRYVPYTTGSMTRYNLTPSTDIVIEPSVTYTKQETVMISEQETTVYTIIDTTQLYKISANKTESESWAGNVYYCSFDKSLPTPLDEKLYIQTSYTDYYPVSIEDFKTSVQSLTMEYIVIGTDLSYIEVNSVAAEINASSKLEDSMIEMKIFVSCLKEGQTLSSNIIWSSGVALKYGVEGIEMSMAAYLSKVNVDYYNSIQDYAFTSENVQYIFTNSQDISDSYGEYYDDNDLYKTLNAQNVNGDFVLENAVRNLGGNDMKGYSLINSYVLILLNQTLTERLVGLLVNKIKYNSTGLTKIGTTIAKELERYINNGFLSTEKAWTDDDLVYNGITIISKNTPLKNGYRYVILPFSTLSEEDLRQHKLPTIYVLVADQYYIRKINIIGELF